MYVRMKRIEDNMFNKYNFKFVKISDLNYPKDGMFSIYADHWWIVTSDGEIMFYKGTSPQCNSSKRIAESIRNTQYPDCEVKQIPFVFIPIRTNDFDYKL
jgi:hypothetical protein